MTQIETNQPLQNNNNKFKWLFFISIAILIVVIILNYRSRLDYENNFGKQSKELRDRLIKLESENNSLSSDLNGKKRILDSYMPYEPLLRNLKLKDSAYNSLPYRYGQRVTIMPDTASAVINSIEIIAGAYEYSVKYIVRTSNGTYIPVSVSDIISAQN
jgi:hypothetical protein